MIHLALALATSGSVAFAQTASTPEELETPPIYVAVRGAVAPPRRGLSLGRFFPPSL